MQYYNDAADNEIHLDNAKLQSLAFSLRDVVSFLQSQGLFAAVYQENDVREAQGELEGTERAEAPDSYNRETKPTE